MKIIKNPPRSEWKSLLARPTMDLWEIESRVIPILQAVKEQGDSALRHYTELFDKVSLANLWVQTEEIERAIQTLDPALKRAIDQAQANIELFHKAQFEHFEPIETVKGVKCWRKSVPIQKVGLYVPSGTAPLFSTVLMLGVPARLAACETVVMASPPDSQGNLHPAVLYAAHRVGISKILKAGGAQAIAAMAFGTESVPQVYKIFGPGNQYVTAAKQLVFREGTAIDMPAGPSEVAVWADQTAVPAFVAADLLSQAEHGTDSQVILVTDSEKLIEEVLKEVEKQIQTLPRRAFAEKAIENSKAFLLNDSQTAVDLLNEYAAEHLIIAKDEAEKWAEKIVNAGSVFLGNYTPESAGDYASGTNHTLPTNGFAKAYSGVSLDSFLKKITYQKITSEGLQNLGDTIEIMAQHEQLEAHRRAVAIRR